MTTRILAVVFACLAVLTPDWARASCNRVKKVITYTALSAAATTGSSTIYTVLGRETVQAAEVRVDTDFAGGAITAYTVSIGKSGSTTKYSPPIDVFTGVANGDANLTYIVTSGGETRGAAITLNATSTGANTNAATAGQVTVTMLVCTIPPGA